MVRETDEEKGKKLDEKTDELLLSLFNALSIYEVDKYNKDKNAVDNFKMYLIDQSIMNAYKDATNQGAFNAVWYKKCHFEENEGEYISKIQPEDMDKINKIKSKEKREKAIKDAAKKKFKEEKYPDSLKGKAIDIMEKSLKTIPSPSDKKKTYDDWHKELCDKLMNLYDNLSEAFTYGNAQKWVNMAVKYLYVYASVIDRMTDFNGKDNPFKNILKQKHNLHVPIDSYVLKAVFNDDKRKILLKEKLFKEDCSENYNYANKDGKLCLEQNEKKDVKKGGKGTITDSCKSCFESEKKQCKELPNSHFTLTWSKIRSYNDYKLIQDKIREIIPKEMSPLDWENKAWLQMAVKG